MVFLTSFCGNKTLGFSNFKDKKWRSKSWKKRSSIKLNSRFSQTIKL